MAGPRTPARTGAPRSLELDHFAQRVLVRLLIAQQRRRIPPPARCGHILQWEILSLRGPHPPEHVPETTHGLLELPALEGFLEPVRGQVPRDRAAGMPAALRMRKQQH